MGDDNPIVTVIRELGLPVVETVAQIAQFREYLLRVNVKINLVSRVDSGSVVDDLIFDSLSMLRHIPYANGATLLDIGSGAGFPWITHKIANPTLAIATIDSNGKKIEFQRAAARLLGFKDCVFYAERAEDVAGLGVDYATAKAFGSAGLIASLAAPHLRPGGLLILPRATGDVPSAIPSGFNLAANSTYQSSFAGRMSNLIIYKKI